MMNCDQLPVVTVERCPASFNIVSNFDCLTAAIPSDNMSYIQLLLAKQSTFTQNRLDVFIFI